MIIASEADSRLGWNLVTGIASTAWTAIVTLCTVPVYLHYLGVEAYGLIGFYTALQAMLAVLDLGLSQSVNREVARAASDGERAEVRDLLHTLALGYWFVAIAIAAALWVLAPWIARHWLSTSISANTLANVIALMGLTVACRFPLGLYLGALNGAQRMGLASGIEIATVTIANLGAIAILAFVDPTIQAFFIWQTAIAVVNIFVVRAVVWRALPNPASASPRLDLLGVRRIWRFSAGLAVTAIIAVVFLQSDKLILSKIVSLADLGRYTLAWIAARSLYVLTAPTFSAVYPQMSSLHAAGRLEDICQLYRFGTRLLMGILFPVAIFLGMFSTVILTIWTGNVGLAKSIHVVVELLLFGTVLNSAMHFPYAAQLAFGRSNLPMIINMILLIFFVPLVLLLSLHFGIAGAAAAWASLNFLYLFFGTWLTHRHMLQGAGLKWISADVGVPFLISLAVVGGGNIAFRPLGLPPIVNVAAGAVFVIVAFAATFFLTPDLARFSQRVFRTRSQLIRAKT